MAEGVFIQGALRLVPRLRDPSLCCGSTSWNGVRVFPSLFSLFPPVLLSSIRAYLRYSRATESGGPSGLVPRHPTLLVRQRRSFSRWGSFRMTWDRVRQAAVCRSGETLD